MLRKLLGDERGATIIEMAIAAPVLATIVIGMSEMANAYSAKLQLVQAAQRTIEKVMQQKLTSTDYSAVLKTEAAAAAGVAESAVTVDRWLECDGVREATYDSNCSGTATYARYVTVVVQKSYTPMFTMFPGTGTDGSYTLQGKAGVRIQ